MVSFSVCLESTLKRRSKEKRRKTKVNRKCGCSDKFIEREFIPDDTGRESIIKGTLDFVIKNFVQKIL